MPKILWMSPYCLHDTSSGASINAFQLLQQLQKQGYTVWSCSGFCCDNPGGAKHLFQLLQHDPNQPKRNVFTLNDVGIHFVFTLTRQTAEHRMTLAECQLFFKIFCQVLDEFKPDFITGYGLSPLPMMCRYEAMRRNIKVMQMLYNGEQRSYTFPDMDAVITDSCATANTYAHSDLINVKPLGISLDHAKYISPVHKPNFITFINPSPAKGTAIFAKLLTICEQEMPELKFLTIESRAKFYEVLERLHTKDKPSEHPFKGKQFKNLVVLPIQSNMKNVYAVTRALIAPSLWFEGWGRVTSEAVLNHIPVLCSTSGGLSEAKGACGISLEAPQHCRDDYESIPTDEEIRPWVDALKQILANDWTEAFKRTERGLDPKVTGLRCMKLLQDLKPSIDTKLNFTIPFDPANLLAAEAPQSLTLQAQVSGTPSAPYTSCTPALDRVCADFAYSDFAAQAWANANDETNAQADGCETETKVEADNADEAVKTQLEQAMSEVSEQEPLSYRFEESEVSTVPLPNRVDVDPQLLALEDLEKYSGQGVFEEPVAVFTPDSTTLLGALPKAVLDCSIADEAKTHPARTLAEVKAQDVLPRDGWVDKCNQLDLNALVDVLQRTAQAL